MKNHDPALPDPFAPLAGQWLARGAMLLALAGAGLTEGLHATAAPQMAPRKPVAKTSTVKPVSGSEAGKVAPSKAAAFKGPAAVPAKAGTAKAPVSKAALPVILIYPLRDAGGLRPEPGQTSMNAGFTESLLNYLAGAEAGKMTVRIKKDKVPVAPGTLVLMGDFSRTDPDAEEGGSFLCTIRLYHQQKDRRLLNYWAASAATFRWVNGNLTNDKRVDKEGMLGELGSRIVRQIDANIADKSSTEALQSAIDRFDAASTKSAVSKRITAEIVPASIEAAPAPVLAPAIPPALTPSAANSPIPGTKEKTSPATVLAGSQFRMRCVSQDAGEIFFVTVDAKGQPVSLLPGSATPVAANTAVTLPTEEAIDVASIAKSSTIVVLVHKGTLSAAVKDDALERAARALDLDNANGSPTVVASPLDAGAQTLNRDNAGGSPAVMASPLDTSSSTPVQVVSGVPARIVAAPDIDRYVARLLLQIASTPADKWTAHRLKVPVAPK